MTDYAFFFQDSHRWGMNLPHYGCASTSAPHYRKFHISSVTQSELSSLTGLKAREDKEKFCNNITFLLVSAEEDTTGDRKYVLSTIWVNPCQARVHSMEEAVRELTAWVFSGSDWPYTLMWLNKDTCHVPLPMEGHLGILPQGGTNMTACRRISQMEVCQFLTSGLQVTYPVGFNGQEGPIITSLPRSLVNGISLTGGGSIYLEVNILQPMAEEPDWKASPLCGHFYPNSQPPQDHSQQTRKRGQHDHGGKESPV